MNQALDSARVEPNGHRGRRVGAREARLGVNSEVGALRRTIVHRPGFELSGALPREGGGGAPADLGRIREARREHDAYADALTRRGVEVLYLNDLLVETLEIPEAREKVIARTLAASGLAPGPRLALAEWLRSLPSLGLAARLVGGVATHERGLGLRARGGDGAPSLLLPPLPDHLLARSISAWIFDRFAVGASAGAVRRRESIHIEAIYGHHPIFGRCRHRAWSDGLGGPARLDGGDVLVLGDRCALIGTGGGTAAISAALIAERLFAAGAADRVIVASSRPSAHPPPLGDAVTMLDRGLVAIRDGADRGLIVHSLRPRAGGPAFELERDLPRAIARAVGVEPVLTAGAGTLAVAPGVVVAYDHEVEANDELRALGIEVIEVPGAELARAGATPRGLATPIARDRVL